MLKLSRTVFRKPGNSRDAFITMVKYEPRLMLFAAILMSYPFLSMAVKGGMNAAFLILIGLSCYEIFRFKRAGMKSGSDRNMTAFAIAMCLPTIALVGNQFALQSFDAHPYDSSLRFMLAIPVYAALRKTSIALPSVLEIAFPVGALTSVVVTILSAGSGERAANYFLSPIHFGDMALILGFLSLFAINWNSPDPFWRVALKLLGLGGGIFVAVMSGTRGAWLAIPVLALLWMYFVNRERRRINPFLGIAVLVLACLASYFFVTIVQMRVDRAFANLTSYLGGNVDSGTAARIELWKASFIMFTEHPLFGVGQEGFKQMLAILHDRGIIDEMVMIEGNAEAHSEIAGNLARYGLVGLISILSLYLVPAYLFLTSRDSDCATIRRSARMGICFTLAFFIFGLTVEIFNIKMVASFYALTVAVLLASTRPSGQEPDA